MTRLMCLTHGDRGAMSIASECRECYDNRVRYERREAVRIAKLEAALRDIAWQALYQPKKVRQTALDALKESSPS